ncbi:MAG: hypothetical protein K2X93_10925 [Candidatus Obscuribacterales bacterium]|nr:hypothetical protein [Candidatus Obscuribacterales bacterium]
METFNPCSNSEKRDLQAEANSLVIPSPCSVNWLTMDGDDTVRFCGQCKKNVHNLTNMSPDELAETLERQRNESLCVFMYRRDDGTVALDNCPSALRPVRNRIRAYAAATLVILIWSLPPAALAQVAGNPDVTAIQGVNTPGTSNFGYNAMENMLCLITGSVTAIAFVLGLFAPYNKKAKNLRKQAVLEWLALSLIPILTFCVGSWIIDSFKYAGGVTFS